MQLSEEIEENYAGNMSAFAERIGDSPQNVQRYCKGEVIPRRDKMARILQVTEGRVQPNDFYALHTAHEHRHLLLTSTSHGAMTVAGIAGTQMPNRAQRPNRTSRRSAS